MNAEMPIKQASYEHQGRELNQEQRDQHQQQRYHRPQASSGPQPGELFNSQPQYEPLPISSSPPQLSPSRTTYDASPSQEEDEDDEDDDRPLAETRLRQNSTSPSRRPTPISNPPKPQDFEVTSRRHSPPLSKLDTGDGGGDDRRVSVMSNKSLNEIYEAYGAAQGSPPLKELSLPEGVPMRGSSLQASGNEEGLEGGYR